MILADIVIGIILLLGFYKGFKKGLFVALASLAGIVAGVYGAVYFSGYAAGWLSQRVNWGEQLINMVAFAITFLGVLYVVSLAGKMLTKIADFAFLGIFNKLLGAVFYGLIAAFIVSVFFMYAGSLEKWGYGISQETKENSILYKPVASLAPAFLPKIIEKTKKLNRNKNSVPETMPVVNDTL